MKDFLFLWRFVTVGLCAGLGLIGIPALFSARSNEAVVLGIFLIACLPVVARGLWMAGERLFNKKEGT